MRLVSGDIVFVEYKHLKKYTNYSFRIAGVNHRGIGLQSLPVFVSTEEDGE